MVVLSKRENVYITRQGAQIFPGVNVIPEVVARVITDDNHFQKQVEKGFIEIIGRRKVADKEEAPKVTNIPEVDSLVELSSMNEQDAINATKGIQNILVLEAISEKEKRPGVAEEARRVIAQMKRDDENEVTGVKETM
jgi:hypothetical protein